MKNRLYKTGLAAVLVLASGSFLAACENKPPSAAKADAAKTTAAKTATKAVSQQEVVRVGVDANFPPMVFRAGDGNLTGFDIELATEAFKRLGLEYDFFDIHWGTKDRQLNEDKTIDVIWSGFNISPERRQVFDFTESYMDNKQVVVVLANSPIQTLADLGGRTVGVQEGSSLVTPLQAINSPNGAVRVKAEYAEYAAELVALTQGKVDASAMGSVAVSYYMQNSPGKFRILAEDLGETSMAAAVRKDDKELLDKLSKVIAEMKADGTVQRIQRNWFR